VLVPLILPIVVHHIGLSDHVEKLSGKYDLEPSLDPGLTAFVPVY